MLFSSAFVAAVPDPVTAAVPANEGGQNLHWEREDDGRVLLGRDRVQGLNR